jgi:hypothetical protein
VRTAFLDRNVTSIFTNATRCGAVCSLWLFLLVGLVVFQASLWLFAPCLFLLSNNLLFGFGVRYMSGAGSFWEKLHPSFYLLCLLCCMTALLRDGARRAVPAWIKGSWRLPLAVAAGVLTVVTMLSRSGGGDLSSILMTFLAPAMLAYVLQFAGAGALVAVGRFLELFFVANSALGLAEFLSGWRLLPFYAADQLITFDARPTALLGHPLINALLTGAVLLISVSHLVSRGLSFRLLCQAVLHFAAMFVFGGRAALVLCCGLVALFLVRRFGLLSKVRLLVSRRAMLLACLGVIGVGVVVSSGIADPLLGRFVSSAKSDQARLASAIVLAELTPLQWMIGMEPDTRRAYHAMLQTPFGFESAPVAMTIAYGLPLALMLLIAVWHLLSRFAKDAFAGSNVVILYFMLASWTSLSIGSKSLLVSQMLVILVCARVPAPVEQRTVVSRKRASAFRRFAFRPKVSTLPAHGSAALVAGETSVICSPHAVERSGHHSRRQASWRNLGHRRSDDPLPWASSGYGAFGAFADDAAGASAGK